MTKKITVSLPDDVAERLSREDNVSAYVSEAVRRRMLSERVREQLRSAGFVMADERIAKADEEYRRLRNGITPELRRQALALQAKIRSGRS